MTNRRRTVLSALLAGIAAPALAVRPARRQAGWGSTRHGNLQGLTTFLAAESPHLAAEYRREPEGRLAVKDRASGAERFAVTAPPLRALWISPDERLIVGLGEGKSGKDHADGVLVYSAGGKLLLQEALAPTGPEHPLFYDEQYSPVVSVTTAGGVTTLAVEDRSGGMHAFPLPAVA